MIRDLFLVHDFLHNKVRAFYDLDEAERSVNQYCYVQQFMFKPPTQISFAVAA